MNKFSTDYHDYVFKDGKLILEINHMYQHSKEIPWYQDRDPQKPEVRILIEILRSIAPIGTVCEAGCGLGYFAYALSKYADKIYGVDISKTVVQKAAALFPRIKLGVYDLMQTKPIDIFEVPDFNLVVIRGTFWYVFQEMGRVVNYLCDSVTPGGDLLIQQNFPDLDSDFIGKNTIPNPQTLQNYFNKRLFLEVENVHQEYRTQGGNDLWVTYLFKKNAA